MSQALDEDMGARFLSAFLKLFLHSSGCIGTFRRFFDSLYSIFNFISQTFAAYSASVRTPFFNSKKSAHDGHLPFLPY